MDMNEIRDKNKGVIEGYGTWAVKCIIVAIVLVVSLQAWKRMDRQNLLVDAILREFQAVSVQRQQRAKAQQELPLPDDPVPTEPRQ